MEKVLARVASGVISTVIIVLGAKVIYNELPQSTQRSLEDKTRKICRAVKETANKVESM